MHLIGALIIGLIAGALAKLIMPGRDPGGILATMLLGVAGSFAAGFFGRAVGWYRDPGSGPGLIASILGALVLLAIYRVATGRSLSGHERRPGLEGRELEGREYDRPVRGEGREHERPYERPIHR